MKKLFILMFFLFLPTQLFAEIIILQSGQIVEGKIIEKTNKYVKVEAYGVTLTYDLNEIESIQDKLEVIVVTEPPKPRKSAKSPAEPIKKETEKSSVWDKWYAGAQPYIQRVKQILSTANAEVMPIFDRARTTKNRNQKRQIIQLTSNKLAPYIQALGNIQPPNGLERWHQLQIRALEQIRLAADAEARGYPTMAQNYANQLPALQATATNELRNALIEHKAPAEVINALIGN